MVVRIALAIYCFFNVVFIPTDCHASFGDSAEVQNETHIKQHLEDKIDLNELTEEQRMFHYFSMNDLDKDNRIDGLEILKSFTHEHSNKTGPGKPVMDEDAFIMVIDRVLRKLDLNGDGYIDYAEFMGYQHRNSSSEEKK